MGSNSFGKNFTITSFGESHGPALGVIIDGCPAGVTFDYYKMKNWLARRRPGQNAGASEGLTSDRKEDDLPRVLSGIFEGKTLGTPIAIVIENKDTKSADYDHIKNSPRLGHADDVWKSKFGHVDHRGGGRSSGRETVSRVIAGSIAEMFLCEIYQHLKVVSFASQIGPFTLTEEELNNAADLSVEQIDEFPARFPSEKNSEEIYSLLQSAKLEGKSYGGKIDLLIKNTPKNLGQPVFHKLKADLASAMLSIGGSSFLEIGQGLAATLSEGSSFHRSENSVVYGGIRGGISTGETIHLCVGFKPTASVLDVAKKGRHDPCILPRAIPVAEAMTWLVIADHILWNRMDRV